jgi:chromosome segregation ATPase
MKLTKLIVSIICYTCLTSCNNDFSSQLSAISELSESYASLDEKVLEIDLKESAEQLKKYETTIEDFKLLLNKDKRPSKETTSFINEFRTIKKTFKKVPKTVSYLKSNIKENTAQLKNLEIDINKNVFNHEQLSKIIDDEEKVFQNLDQKHTKLTLEIKNQLEKFDSLLILSTNMKF